jgi:hypothetical protein
MLNSTEPRFGKIPDMDGRMGVPELLGYRSANSLRTSGDNGNLARKIIRNRHSFAPSVWRGKLRN